MREQNSNGDGWPARGDIQEQLHTRRIFGSFAQISEKHELFAV